jgi:predicted DCC family thiol-disulfide oxidoreductase YuxK
LIRSGRSPDDISSIIVCLKDGTAYEDSEAVLMVATGLQEPLPMVGRVGKIVPTFLRDGIFKYVSQNRYRFLGALAEEYDSCRIDWDGEFDDRFVLDP